MSDFAFPEVAFLWERSDERLCPFTSSAIPLSSKIILRIADRTFVIVLPPFSNTSEEILSTLEIFPAFRLCTAPTASSLGTVRQRKMYGCGGWWASPCG